MKQDDGTRLFQLSPYEEPDTGYLEALAHSMMEPAESFVDPSLDNPDIPAGMTYFGQFLNHDISVAGSKSPQWRSPRLDLDSLYGLGPRVSTSLDQGGSNEFGVFALGHGVNQHEPDLPRSNGVDADIGDQRNDQSVMLGQLHLGFIKFHNAVLSAVLSRRCNSECNRYEAFFEARKLVCWHFQWIVLRKFLPLVVGDEVIADILPRQGRANFKLYDVTLGPHVPLEFSGAAFRFGHSMARPSYQLNGYTIEGAPIPLFVQDAKGYSKADLRGVKRLQDHWTVQWSWFLPVFNAQPQQSRLIDARLATPLEFVPTNGGATLNLALVTLRKGITLGLPSGQAIARAMACKPVCGNRDDPLWYYILREAEIEQGGRRLGKVGGRIVAEVLIGLMLADQGAFLASAPEWTPTLPNRDGKVSGDFDLGDLLYFAGMPMTFKDMPV